MSIPDKFHKAGKQPHATNVGQLKQLLTELPDDLSVQAEFGEPVELVVYNYGQWDQHLQIREHNEDEE